MQHNVFLEGRKILKVSGVVDVESFCEEKIVLITEEESLIVEGFSLHIQKLSVEDGELLIEGEIASLIYNDKISGTKSSGGLFSRLLR